MDEAGASRARRTESGAATPGGVGGSPVSDAQVAAVREFNRFYTTVLGLLREGLLDTPYSLTEARIIFELARQGEAEVTRLRTALDLDAGYLSRILARFAEDGLVTRARSAADARRQVIGLTSRGAAVYGRLGALADDQIRGLLAPVSPERRQELTGAMAKIRENLGTGKARVPTAFVLRPPAPGDLGWVVQRNGALYAAQYGWDESYEALVAGVVAGYAARQQRRGQEQDSGQQDSGQQDPAPQDTPRREAGWIAELDGEPAGCVFCMHKSGSTAQLRLLLVEPWARGLGIGGRLVAECVTFARRAGYTEIVLWTNDVLHAARRIYQRAGFELAGSNPHHSFGHDLVGEDWRLTLR
jgi:DNA-binding MarR family transcriptional regulator/GNAT superfamily N-acetyltransferase